MKTRLASLLLPVLILPALLAQETQQLYVRNFPGATVLQKLTNAQASCDANLPCVLILDPVLSASLRSTPPAPARNQAASEGLPQGADVKVFQSAGMQVVGQGNNTTIQAAINAAGATGAVMIPASYGGNDTFTNPNRIAVYDYRLGAMQRGVIDVTDFGAVADAQYNATGTISPGAATLTISGSPSFSPSDVGKTIALRMGTRGNALVTTISGYTSASQVTLATAAVSGGSGLQVWWGTDNTAAFNAATMAAGANPTGTFTRPGGITVYVPAGAYLFSGTSPVYLRGGEVLRGAIQTASQLISVSPGGVNLLKVGTNSAGKADASGLETGVYSLMFAMPFSPNACSVAMMNTSGWDVEDNNFASGGIGLCIPSGTTVGLVTGNTFDSNLFNDIQAIGNGVDPNGSNHSVVIAHNMFFAPRYGGVELEGVTDYVISGNTFQYAHYYGVWGAQQLTDRRISIIGNNFLTSTNSGYYTPGQWHISFATSGAGGLAGSVIADNVFNLSRAGDIELDGANTGYDRIADNYFVSSSQGSTTGRPGNAIYIPLAGGITRIIGNVFNQIGGYAVNSSAPIDAEENQISGAFTLSGVPSQAYSAGAITTVGSISIPSVERDNFTFDTTYPVAANNGGTQTIFSGGNVSQWTWDVVNDSAAITSGNERVDMYGGTANPASFAGGITGTQPVTFTLGPAAGADATVSCMSGYRCTQLSGALTITTGTSPAAGTLLTISWNAPLAAKPVCEIGQQTGGSGVTPQGISQDTTTTTSVTFYSSPLTASGTTNLDYQCLN